MKKNNLMTLSSCKRIEHDKFARHEKEQILMQIKTIHFTSVFFMVCIACPHVKVHILLHRIYSQYH